jgi:endonuclease/exonuclease/phosphatase family metal-dependent hydrolase
MKAWNTTYLMRWLSAFFFLMVSCPVLSAEESGRPLRVLTFNIRYGTANDGPNHWKFRREKVFAVLREEHPSVCGLQEALRFQLDEIAAAVPGYQELGVGRDDGKTKGEYAAILVETSRFSVVQSSTVWLSDTPTQPGSKSWGNTIPRVYTQACLKDRRDGRLLHVLNVHLDHLSAASRLKSAEKIGEWLKTRPAGERVLVTGDFNAEPDSEPIRLLVGDEASGGAGLEDILPEKDAGTFHYWKGVADGPRIDLILVGRGWKTSTSRIRVDSGPPYPSDHYPVFAEIPW